MNRLIFLLLQRGVFDILATGSFCLLKGLVRNARARRDHVMYSGLNAEDAEV